MFDAVLDKAYQKIEAKARLQWTRILYEVPPFVVGLPPYCAQECSEHLVRHLKRAGYVAELYGETLLYVSWDVSESEK